MEFWFIYSVLSAIFGGLYHFTLKYSAQNNHNGSNVTFYSSITTATLGAFMLIFYHENNKELLWIFLFSLGAISFYFISTLTRIESLKNINTTIYYPVYKSITAIFILIIGFLIFNESLTVKQFIGIVIGIFVTLLLFKKDETNKQKNLKYGLMLLLIGAVMTAGTSIMSKSVANNNYNIFYYMFFTYAIGTLYSHIYYQKTKIKKHSKKNVKRIGIISGTLYSFAFYFFMKALQTGILTVVFTINTFSILIPVLLSVTIYKEHFDRKKGFALTLAILSLVLLK